MIPTKKPSLDAALEDRFHIIRLDYLPPQMESTGHVDEDGEFFPDQDVGLYCNECE